MGTPHNSANMGDIAKTVIMPGDPLRAKFIAETFLENPVQFNTVRNMFGYTGTYKGRKVSVMGSGMGIPSISLYAYELYSFYGVENIVRVGSCGAYTEELDVYDTILVTGSHSESSFAKEFCDNEDKIQKPSDELNTKLKEAADKLGIQVHEGLISSSDVFYSSEQTLKRTMETVKKYNLLAAEMESFGLFAVAKFLGKKGACMLTVSDHLVTHKETTAEERQTRFLNMIKIALEAEL